MSTNGLSDAVDAVFETPPAPTTSGTFVRGRAAAAAIGRRGGRWVAIPSILAVAAGSALGQGFVWDGGCANDNWFTCCDRGQLKDNNWELEPVPPPNCPPLPGPSDDVDLNGAAVRLTPVRSVAIKSLMNGHLILLHTLDVEESATLDQLTLNGQLTLGGSLTVTGHFDWQGNNLIGPEGSEAFANDTVRLFSSGRKVLFDRKLVCHGAVTWTDIGHIALVGGAIENNASFTFDNASVIEGTGRFINKGMFSKTINPGETRVAGGHLYFENAEGGTIDVQTGTLFLEGGGESRGAISVAQTAVLRFNTVNPAQPFTFQVPTNITGDGVVRVSANGIKAGQGAVVVVNNLLAGGTLHGPGGYNVRNLEWTGGTITGGAQAVAEQLNLAAVGSNMNVDGAALTARNAVWGASARRLVLNNDGQFVVAERMQITGGFKVAEFQGNSDWIVGGNARLEVMADTDFGVVQGTGRLTNRGEMIIDTNVCRMIHLTQLEQLGTLRLERGDLWVSSGKSSGGTFELAAGTDLLFKSQTYQVENAQFNGDGLVTIDRGTVEVLAGDGPGTTTVKNLKMNILGGTVTGDGELQVTDNFAWEAGKMTGAGKTTIQGDATIDIGTDHVLSQRTLRNEGSTRWIHGNITLDDGAVLENAPGADFEVETIFDFRHGAGADGKIENEGAMHQRSGVDALIVPAGVQFNNKQSGVVNLQSGDMRISGGGTSNGLFSIAQDGTVDLASPSYVFAEGARSIGKGNVRLVSGILSILGSDVPVQNFELANGAVDGGFVGTLRVLGNLNLVGGVMRHGDTRAENTLETNPGALITLVGHDLVNAGIGTLGENTTWQHDASEFVNEAGAQLLAGNANFRRTPEGRFGVLRNRGFFSVRGLVSTEDGIEFHNDGGEAMVAVGEPGSLDIEAGGRSSGTFNTLDGGRTRFSGGTYHWDGGTELTGDGEVHVDFEGVCSVNSVVNAENFHIGPIGGGAIEGGGTLVVTRVFRWFTTARGAGRLVNRASDAAVVGAFLDTRRFENDGEVVVNGLTMSNSAEVDNRALVIVGVQGITGTADELFSNSGDLNAPFNSTIRVRFFNTGGTVRVASEGSLRFTMSFVQTSSGRLILEGQSVAFFDQDPVFAAGTRVEGDGSVSTPRTRSGATFAPGSSAGTLTIEGDYVQQPEGALEIELGGLVPDVEHDVFVVTGDAALGGTMEILLIDGFEPQVGDMFTVMTYGSHSGEFDRVIPPCGYAFGVHYNANDVTLEVTGVGVPRPGDLDGDCDIDLDDYKRVAPCIGGPSVETPPQGCHPDDFAAADLDGDLDVDVRDVGALFNVFAPP
ncbi:MAG: hypothetical protein C4547_04885 [Phycisphaerales bacterium]|nr:MAG: hypothetical protein C4547_04885 [Phycisphaerales bacterium]